MKFTDELLQEMNNVYDANIETYFSGIPAEFCEDTDCIVSYGKDNSLLLSGREMFSNSILRHIDAEKCLYQRLSSRQSADSTAYYHTSDKQLRKAVFAITPAQQQIIIYPNRNTAVKYLTNGGFGKTVGQFMSMEIAIRNEADQITSVMTFNHAFKSPYGISMNCERYFYNDDMLVKAEYYEDYNSNYVPNPIITSRCPDILLNPKLFLYEFNYDSWDVTCQQTHFFSASTSNQQTLVLKKSEVEKLSKYGITCLTSHRQ